MKFLLTFAWKNLFRYRRRTLITAGALAVGLTMFIYVDSMLAGADQETVINLRRYETAGGKIIHRENLDQIKEGKLEHLVADPQGLYGMLEGMNIPYAPRTSFAAEAIVEDGSQFLVASGIDTALDENVFQLKETIIEGAYPRQGELEVLLGRDVAKNLKVSTGDYLTLRTRTPDGYSQVLDLRVSGLIYTPNPQVNRAAVYLPLDVVDEFLYMAGRVTEIALNLPEYAEVEKAIAPVRQALQGRPELMAADWRDLSQDYLAIANLESTATKLILFMIFIIAAVGISNTMLMAIFERIREIGMMRAMGMKNRDIRLAFMLEAGGIGLLGSLFGLVLSCLLVWHLVAKGLDFRFMVEDMDMGYRITGIFRGIWNFGTMGAAFAAGIILSGVVAYFPTRKALKLSIPDALHHN